MPPGQWSSRSAASSLPRQNGVVGVRRGRSAAVVVLEDSGDGDANGIGIGTGIANGNGNGKDMNRRMEKGGALGTSTATGMMKESSAKKKGGGSGSGAGSELGSEPGSEPGTGPGAGRHKGSPSGVAKGLPMMWPTQRTGYVTPKKKERVTRAKKKAISGSRRTARKTNAFQPSFATHIRRVLKQVHPNLSITCDGIDIMNDFLIDIFERIAGEAALLIRVHKRCTLTCREIMAAVQLVLGGELSKHAIHLATEVLTLFSQ
ncbi:hypothetical protein CBR_g8606 [Chara braunii]|nr:hypothetical protein CBR_g8606 [Chara braunii]|eukprot:GBG60585.1 hypothetical protein CBR_g8606 [Chara braunii]